jgi:hypothetical protein
MKRILQTLSLGFAVCFLAACDGGVSLLSTLPASTETVVAELGDPFIIHVGQVVVVGPMQLVVKDLKDIRCPSQVLCAEKGFAQLTVEIIESDGSSHTYLMNSDPFYQPQMGVGTRVVPHDGYRIELLDVSPYPELPEDDIHLHAYLLSFLITKEE